MKANANALTTAAASSGATITHFAIYSASTAGTQKTDWQALTASRAVSTGDQLTVAIASCAVTLT